MNSMYYVCCCSKEGVAPTLQNMLRGRKVMSEIYVRRIPLDEVPDDDEGASNYLHELYRSKVQTERNTLLKLLHPLP